jgi:hypothetical protein
MNGPALHTGSRLGGIGRRRLHLPRLRRVSWFLLVLAVLQALDLATTLLLLSIGGVEANPIAAWSLAHGVPTYVVLKLALAGVLLAFIPPMEREREPRSVRAAARLCLGLDALFGAAVVSNALQFLLFV